MAQQACRAADRDGPGAMYRSSMPRAAGPPMDAKDKERRLNRARSGRGFGCRSKVVLVGALLVIAATWSEAQAALKQVLLLQSLDRGNLVLDQFTGDFRVHLDAGAGEPVNVVQIVVGPTGFVGAPEQAVVDFVRSTY